MIHDINVVEAKQSGGTDHGGGGVVGQATPRPSGIQECSSQFHASPREHWQAD